jgi:hypothetical protein
LLDVGGKVELSAYEVQVSDPSKIDLEFMTSPGYRTQGHELRCHRAKERSAGNHDEGQVEEDAKATNADGQENSVPRSVLGEMFWPSIRKEGRD